MAADEEVEDAWGGLRGGGGSRRGQERVNGRRGDVGGDVRRDVVAGGGFSCGDGVTAASDLPAGLRCGICFSEAAACSFFVFQLSVRSFSAVRGGVTARDGSERAAWSESRAVAGTRPGTAADEAEGVAVGGAKTLVGEAEAAGAAMRETTTGAATGGVEAIDNAEAETGGAEAVADAGVEETSEGTAADETKAAVADEAEAAAAGGANSAAAAGDAGDTTVDETGMTMEGGGTVGEAGRAGAWADAATDGTGCETAVDETGAMATGRAGGAMAMATGRAEALEGEATIDRVGGAGTAGTTGAGDVRAITGDAGRAETAGTTDKAGEAEAMVHDVGTEAGGGMGVGKGSSRREIVLRSSGWSPSQNSSSQSSWDRRRKVQGIPVIVPVGNRHDGGTDAATKDGGLAVEPREGATDAAAAAGVGEMMGGQDSDER
ncbi:hypothetical protein F5148DRAFT_1150254 [Russula earlei]|uniref:Uncharacterized protein n=1 Tax=Russula earlei TaxID=71964 RepID=A0ACC0U5G7_9AGAM|nr:hypothetical protein F5148DRAFT_1150254 [Russula earlei]